MITLKDLITDWNNAGRNLNADFLGKVFKKLETPEDVAIHNFIMYYVDQRLGPHGGEFTKKVADLIHDISLRNLEDGTKNEKDKKS